MDARHYNALRRHSKGSIQKLGVVQYSDGYAKQLEFDVGYATERDVALAFVEHLKQDEAIEWVEFVVIDFGGLTINIEDKYRRQ